MRPLDAVTFDFWQTLCTDPSWNDLGARRVAAMGSVLDDEGVVYDPAALRTAYAEAWESFVQAWETNRQFGGLEAAHEMLDRLDGVAPRGSRRRDALVESFFASVAEPGLELLPGVTEALAALHERGVRLGIVCDVGFTPSPVLRRELRRHGVHDRFHHFSFSDEVGTFKPDLRIFEHALDGLGVEPERAAHVGDRRRTDVAGARAMGMVAVRYAGVVDDVDPEQGPEGHVVIHHHDELLVALGL